jgi:nucleoside-diphosphate-sugar epimerase
MTKILVTGASGFIGHHLARFLKRRGYWVRGVDWREPRHFIPDDHFDEVDYGCDLRDKHDAVMAFRGIDHAYCLAADMGGMGFISTNHYRIIHNNALINANSAEAARRAGVKRLFFSSSACIYPIKLQERLDAPPLAEGDAWAGSPEDAYGKEKLLAEEVYTRLAERTGCAVRIARFHNIYGPEGSWNDGREKAPAAACRKIAEYKLGMRNAIDIWGDGSQQRSFCFVDDCLWMIHDLMLSDFEFPLNIGTDEQVSIKELYDIVADIAGVDTEELYWYDMSKPQGVRSRNADLSAMKAILKYTIRYNLTQGLIPTYSWIKEQVSARTKE